MSTRTQLYSITSMEPILKAVGSGDEKLMEAIIGDSADDDAGWARSMLSSSPPDVEPGAWNYVVHNLAEHMGLEMKFLKLDDWKHYGVWDEYIPRVECSIGEDCTRLLSMLKQGRPLKGSSVEHDGCCFAWLSPEETTQLLSRLKAVESPNFSTDEDIEQFTSNLLTRLNLRPKLVMPYFLLLTNGFLPWVRW